jgi:hypothetical protein
MAQKIITMGRVLKSVLASANKEQNQHYPPHIFNEHFVLVTKWLLDEIAKIFPTQQTIVDLARSFLKTADKQVKNGLIPFPDDYRNLLSVSIFSSDDFKTACDCTKQDGDGDECSEFENDPIAPTDKQIESKIAERRARSKRVKIVDIDEWDYLTQHVYKKPTLQKPIACIFEGEGIRICPFDVPSVEVRFLRNPKDYVYNYDTLPDDTYVFNTVGSEESEWFDNAATQLYKGVATLYAMYVKDTEMRDYNIELKNSGIF